MRRTKSPEQAACAAHSVTTAPRLSRSFGGDRLEQAAQEYRSTNYSCLQRRRGEDLPCDATAQRCEKVAHRILHEYLLGGCSSSGRKLCKLIEKRKRWDPARPYVSWDRGIKRHAPVPVRPYLSRFNGSLASADTPVPQAAAATVEDASVCVTNTSASTGRPGRYMRRSLRWESRWEDMLRLCICFSVQFANIFVLCQG